MTPGGGQVMPHARGLLGVLWAARLAIFHRARAAQKAWPGGGKKNEISEHWILV